MNTIKYFFIDVFAGSKYKGNPLAVFLTDNTLSEESMLALVKEVDVLETTFVLKDPVTNTYSLRIFTPTAEIPFSGHPSLGTAFIIKEFILKQNITKLNLNLKIGKIPVELTYRDDKIEELWVKQKQPLFGQKLSKEDIIPVLGLKPDEINENFPIQVVSSAGLPIYVVPARDLKALRKIKVNLKEYYKFVCKVHENKHGILPTAFFVFSPEAYTKRSNNVSARTFDDFYGVPEDAASGSYSGCLLAYMMKYKYFNKADLNLSVEQGNEIQRPSLIRLKGSYSSSGKFDVRVGGKVQLVAEGSMYY
jgi:trans-2,3-dihydro-3-hydroxyanthranilate isomerase